MEVVSLTSLAIPINSNDSSQIGHARRLASSLATSMGFGELRIAELGIIVTEAARNIANHAGQGTILLSPQPAGRPDDEVRIDIYALDSGPGILNIPRAQVDGFSTAGTPGQGLGAISRLASDTHIYSAPQKGTILFASVSRNSESGIQTSELLTSRELNDQDRPPSCAAICIPIHGETVCGDAWAWHHTRDRQIYILADGLGHGPNAAEASQEALRVFETSWAQPPERILKEIHGALAKTRGAAVSIAEVLPDAGVVNFAGAGNVVGAVHSGGKTRNMVSMNGTIGHSVARLQQFSYPWERNSILIMHSDGLTTRWNVEQYSGLSSGHPALLAGALFRDFQRGRDDATVLVSRR
ncbi:ATP-binding SpoIIE family protein phosphatase [Acidicapsa ligni]|uniref:ATP-binding SpoIIE family protein phosphatase n=1 Tax=Acidicapsa ligni TaxID=542300 RepID=UPI0021E04707|nr:ATP-binding SpoIIE family protein phosphatase [Acidicapsa ligni]